MARYKFLNQVPPGGYWYIQRETALRIEGDSIPEVAKKTIAHRQYKGLQPTDYATVALEVERQICSRLGEDHCRKEGSDDPWQPLNFKSTVMKVGNVFAFSRAAFEWLTSGRELVSREKAEGRAKGCASCPLNWPLTGCKCSKIIKLISKAVPADKQFDNLGVCMACECSLPAKVWLPRNVVDASNAGRNIKFPQDGSCWQYNEATDPQG